MRQIFVRKLLTFYRTFQRCYILKLAMGLLKVTIGISLYFLNFFLNRDSINVRTGSCYSSYSFSVSMDIIKIGN